jgi:hypothetical protein
MARPRDTVQVRDRFLRIRATQREKNRVDRLRGRLSESDYIRGLIEADATARNDHEPD